MSALDELRTLMGEYLLTVELEDVFDPWVERRTLVDLSTCNETCPAFGPEWSGGGERGPDSCHVSRCLAPTGSPCPVLEGRKT